MTKRLILLLLLIVNYVSAQNFSNHYNKRKTLFEAAPDTQNEIIFLGNSITEGGQWKILFPKKNVINRGISGDITDGILYRLNEVISSKPLKVFLMVGTNDLARGKSIEYVIKGTREIISKIQQQSKNTKIYLQSILPVNPKVGKKFSGHKSNQQKIIEANKQLQQLAKTLHVTYIDLHQAMRNRAKHLKPKFTYDGLHLSEKGYLKWKRVIKKYIN